MKAPPLPPRDSHTRERPARGLFSPSLPGKGDRGNRTFARALLGAVTVLGLSGAVLAAPDAPELAPAPRRAKPALAAPEIRDTFDILIFTNLRPVRVRMTALHEGKRIAERWREELRRAFDFCDRNGDGVLDEKEIGYAIPDQGLNQIFVNGFYSGGGNAFPTLAELDKDGDGTVSFEEFAAYYVISAAQVIRMMPVQPDNLPNASVTEALFTLLDADGDGKLTRAEVTAAEKLLATRDADEDECLSMQELVPNMSLGGRAVRTTRPPDALPYPVPAAQQTVLVYESGRIPGTVTQQVIKKYDRDADFELTRAESGFDEQTFTALDRDGNGKLNGEELDVWRTGAPDLELTLSLAPKAADCVAQLRDEKSAAARGFKVKQVEGGRLVLHVGRQPIDFWAFSPVAQYAQAPLKQQYGYLFTQAAGDKKYVEDKDLSGPNAVQFQFIRVILDAADRNADGKLTREEFDAYFDLQDSFHKISFGLLPAIRTPTLFQLLDENRDGRLSVRELRTAWDRLIVLEEPGATVITKNVIQPSIALRLARGNDRYTALAPTPVYTSPPNQVPQPTKGPLWFRKMDRNGDGDVSRAEYIGPKHEFDAIDTDHDELISIEEAEAYDKKMRAKDGK